MKYKVKIRMVEYLETEVEADSFEEAEEIAMELDGDVFTPTGDCSWDWTEITDENGKARIG